MTNFKTVSLQQNGLAFNTATYTDTDNLDAIILHNNSLVNVRVAAMLNGLYDEVSINILSDKKQMDKEFLEFIENFEEDYDARNYVVNAYQENLYPFVFDDEINDFNLMVRWVYENMKDEESINLIISSFSLVETKIIINRNDLGVIVDYYDSIHDEPLKTKTFYFEDYIESTSQNEDELSEFIFNKGYDMLTVKILEENRYLDEVLNFTTLGFINSLKTQTFELVGIGTNEFYIVMNDIDYTVQIEEFVYDTQWSI